jgi:hypothetical protein
MKRPDETDCALEWDQAGKLSGGRHLMKKIILVSREPGNHERMIALIEAVFPECTVEIIPGTVGDIDRTSVPHENDMGS